MRVFPLRALLSSLLLSAMFSAGVYADDITLSGVVAFNSLDGSAEDHDGAANGVFTVDDGNLVIDGTIQCNDDLPRPLGASACPIRLSVSGDLVLNPGGAVLAENRRGAGSGGSIELEVGGDLVLYGPSGALPGSLISSSRTSGSTGSAGSISAVVNGGVELEPGSIVAAGNPYGQSGAIEIQAEGPMQIGGLIASGPGRNLLADRWNGVVLNGGTIAQLGGSIILRSAAPEPGIQIESTGTVVSQSEKFGMQLVLLEACGIEVRGLVAAVTKGDGGTRVALRSANGILVDGQDLANAGGPGSRQGRIRSDSTKRGTAGFLVDLFAQDDIQALGPAYGSTSLFAVSANPGNQTSPARGAVTAVSLSGSITAHGNAIEAGRWWPGDKGGVINLSAAGNMDLDGAHLRAVGDYSTTSSARQGGQITLRSYQGEVAWTFGRGDVRPTGSAVPAAQRGSISITACSGIDVTGTSFPVQGSPVAPFPAETDGVCAPSAPSLPPGEPALPVCGQPGQSPVADNQSITTDEDTPVTVTLTGSDPDGDSLTFSIVSDPDHGTLGPLTPLTPTSAQVVYTPETDYSGSDSFTFQVDDGNGGTATGVVSITVNDMEEVPTAVDDTAVVGEDSGANNIDVLANDTDPNGVGKSIQSVTQPTHGTVVILPGGASLTYQPNADYCGSDSFTYTLNGGSSANVVVSVTCVNDAPVLADATIEYTTVGNTQLRVGEGTSGKSVVHIRDNSDVDEKSSPSDIEGNTVSVVPFSGLTPNGGNLVLNSDGTFTYEPAAGFEGNDVITFQVIDNGSPAAVSNGTLTVTVSNTVWYVHDVVGENNPEPDDTGRSTNAFEDLEDVASVLTDNDYIYVFEGNTATAPHGGIRLNKTGVKLIGAGVALNVPGFDNLIAPGSQPWIVNTVDVPAQEDHGVGVDATTVSLSGVEIRGLNISGRDNGIDVTAVGGNSAEVTISNNTITSDGATGLEGIDINANSTGATAVTVVNNSLTGRGNVFDARTGGTGTLQIDFSNNANILSSVGSGVVIDGSGGGTTTITGFANNSVDSNTAGTGININAATFDQTPGGAFQTVVGGTTVVGGPGIGSGVGASGVVLSNVTGDLAFTDLDVFADNGSGLQISGTGAVNVGGATGTRVTVGAGVGIIEATGGPAVDVNNATIDLQLSSLRSTTSTRGVSLVNVTDGTTGAIFSAGSGSSITATAGASGPAFNVNGGNAAITFPGTITNNGVGRAVSIASWSGDDAGDDLLLSGAIDENGSGILINANGGSRSITFSGGMDIDTGANEGFAATSNTNAGGLHVTGTNTVDTTTATALRVTSTPIGNSGVTFRSITAGTGSGSNGVGIVLDGTGTGAANGGLTVTGNSGPGTGGTIQHKTGADGATSAGIGIFLNNTKNVSLNWMQLNDFDNSAIAGRNVHGFSLQNSVINGTIGTTNAGAEGPIAFGLSNPGGADGLQGTGLIRNTRISGGVEHNLEFYNQSGTMNLTIAGINAVSEGANPNSAADDVADCIIEENSAALGGDGIQVEMQGTAAATVVIDRCLFRDNKSQAVQVAANNSSAVTVTIDESRVRRFDQGNEGFILSNGGDGDLTALVSNNHVNGIGGTTIFVGQTPGNATAASVLNATITGNVINQPTTATNHGISALLTSTVGQLSQARVRIDGNTVTNNSTAGTVRGIIVDTPDASTSPVFHATVTNNTVSVGDNVAGVSGIIVQGRQSSDVCASIGGNTVTFPNGNPGVFGLRARQVAPGAYDLEQSGGCTGTAATVLACRNPGSTTEVLGTLTVVPAGACLLPVTP